MDPDGDADSESAIKCGTECNPMLSGHGTMPQPRAVAVKGDL